MRFINEYDYVRYNGGIVIYIDRNQTPGNHRSESEVITLYNEGKFDYIINNNGSIKDLFKKVKCIVSKL